MSRRTSGRSRRWIVAPSGVSVPAPTVKYDFETANITKDGSNIISAVTNQGTEGSAWNLGQGTAARRPLWVDNGITSDAVEFAPDGTNIKTMFGAPSAAPYTTTGYTIFIVLNRSAGTGSHSIWLYNTGSARGGWQLEFVTTTRSFQARTSGGTVKSLTFGAYTNGVTELWAIRNYAGGSNDADSSAYFDIRINGATQAYSGNPWFWVPTSHSTTIGNSTTASGQTMRIGAARCYSAYLETAQVQAVERELATAYGITLP